MKLFRFFWLYLLFALFLHAEVSLNSSDTYIKNEPFIFEFSASGDDVKFPKIEKVGGFLVENIGTSRSLQIVNSNYKEKITKRYKILANTDFEIPSFVFNINGKEFKTQAKKITEKKIKKTASNNFDLTLSSSKNELFVGEELQVKLIFKYKKGLRITDLGFEQPHFNNFWYKRLDNNNRRYEKNGYVIQELDFLLFPQKSGELRIPPLRVDVQLVDNQNPNNFGFFALTPKLIKVYSNDLIFKVKELPSNTNFIGEFSISANIDKSKIILGEALSYKLTISGWGNLDDIQDIDLNIPKASVYGNKPELKADFKDGKYQGIFTKVYSIIPNESLLIPSVKFKYYSKLDKKVKEIKTKSFKIEVEGKKKEKVILEKSQNIEPIQKEIIIKKDNTLMEKISFFIFGFLFAVLIFGLFKYVKLHNKRDKKETPLIKLVKNSKNKLHLVRVLAPFVKKDERLDKLIFRCEENIDFKVLKADLIRLLKELKI